MIYLDYSNTTPMSLESLDTYSKISKEFIDSPSISMSKSKTLLDDITKELSNIFNIMEREIIYTSGAVEANTMALVGVSLANHKNGKHIITSKLEQPYMYDIFSYLESIGFEISYVPNDEDGLISFDTLRSLIREDTILVSISAVNAETGVREPLKMLRQIIKKENDHTIFHSDLSMAIGKTQINFRDIDLGTVSSHHIYGPKGVGFLYKNDSVKMMPLYGKREEAQSNEIPINLVASMLTAIKNVLKDLDKKERYVSLLNNRLVDKLSKIDGITINKTKYSIPHILNISFDNVISSDIVRALYNNDIIVSGNNQSEISNSVFAIYNDLKRSKQTMRISLSHLTTVLEINRFLEIFEVEYKKLNF